MKATRQIWILLLLLPLITAFQLRAQQIEVDLKLFEEIKAKAESGDAVAQDNVGFCYSSGNGVKKDAVEAVKWFRKGAEQGFAHAQKNLGICYFKGEGVEENAREAVNWFRKAAEQGNADAQYSLGLCYERGNGVAEDITEAVKWYRNAAEQGNVEAQNSLGVCYQLGHGVNKDAGEGAKWYRKAAEQGNANGQILLGGLYSSGNGVAKDYVEAYKWSNLSTAQGNNDAKKILTMLEKQMTREQIADGQQLSREFKPSKESNSGDTSSQGNLSASGTGFFITEDGFLVTNEHLVKDATQIRLVTSAGFISAKVVKVDAANDLALLKIANEEGRMKNEETFKPLAIAASRPVKLGSTVTTVGFPNIGLQGFAPKFARGEIASLSGAGDDARYFQISVPVQPGNSGGALVDERGNVVGVVSAKLNARAALASSGSLPENVNYAVKSSFLLGFLESVPEVSAKLKEPNVKEIKFEDAVKAAEQAAVLVLVY